MMCFVPFQGRFRSSYDRGKRRSRACLSMTLAIACRMGKLVLASGSGCQILGMFMAKANTKTAMKAMTTKTAIILL